MGKEEEEEEEERRKRLTTYRVELGFFSCRRGGEAIPLQDLEPIQHEEGENANGLGVLIPVRQPVLDHVGVPNQKRWLGG